MSKPRWEDYFGDQGISDRAWIVSCAVAVSILGIAKVLTAFVITLPWIILALAVGTSILLFSYTGCKILIARQQSRTYYIAPPTRKESLSANARKMIGRG